MRIRHLILGGSLAVSLFGCAVDAQEPVTEPAESQSAELLADQSTYYSVRQDYRKCVYPLCGGVWVSAVNKRSTRCLDGRLADACYVPEVDLASLGLPETQEQDLQGVVRGGRVILRGKIANKRFPNFGNLGVFQASEAWEPTTSAEAVGNFFRVTDSGIRCITHPCPSFHEAKLNTRKERKLSSIDLGQIGASDEGIAAGYAATATPDGLLIAGTHYTDRGPAGRMRGLEASQFYLKVTARAETKCVVTGCSGQICADEHIATTCEWRDEYACYQSAVCERQKDGSCGFTQTDELSQCLADTSN